MSASEIIKEYLVNFRYVVDKKSLEDADKKLGEFMKRFKGKWLEATSAVVAFQVAAGAAMGKFAMDMAKADQQAQIFAMRLLTTVKNARSLKTVMDAMNIQDLDQLRDINLNPELRAQFMSLRQLSLGLEPSQDIKDRLKEIRQIGYEFQRFKVIATYALQYVAADLMKYLHKPLSSFRQSFKDFNDKFAKNIKQWADAIAKFLAIFGRLLIAGAQLLTMLQKVPLYIRVIGAAFAALIYLIQASPLVQLIAAIGAATGAITLLADDYFTYKRGGGSALPGLWETLEKISRAIEHIDAIATVWAEKHGLAKGYNAVKGFGTGAVLGGVAGAVVGSAVPGVGTAAGAAVGAGLGAGAGSVVGWHQKTKISAADRQIYKEFADKMADKYQIQRGFLRALIQHESGFNPNAINKNTNGTADVGIAQINDVSIRDYKKRMDPYYSIEYAAKRLSAAIQHYHGNYYLAAASYNAGQGAVDSGHIPAQSKRYANEIIRDAHITINVNGAGDPNSVAHAVHQQIKNSLSHRSLQGAYP